MGQDERDILLAKLADASRKVRLLSEQLEIANKKLKEYEEKALKAEKASQMKSLFLANMSHEIRTPLNAIEGFSRVIAETDSDEERMKYYQIIESNNQRLTSLINEILDLSRVESGEIQIKKEDTDINLMCENIKQLFKFRCPDFVKLEFKKPLMTATMKTDANRLIQVLSNLISNALKHTTMGSITYGFRIIKEMKEIEFFVKDTGSGIPPEFIDNIFNTYASQDAEQQKGYGGYSQERTTTTTNVRTIRVSARPDEMNQKTILVAEDEDSNYELVKIVLQKRYRLIRAHNGIEAVNLNEDEHPDLILMDIRMPEMNGFDATRIIKEVNHDTPVIALSAYAFDENIREAKMAGCDEFMAKPFRVENLIEMVKKYLDED